MTLTPFRAVAFVTVALLLGACASQQSSPERHARHAVHQLAQAHFDPNTRTHISDSMRWALPFFDQFYQAGKSDRARGITYQQAQQKETYFRSPEFLPDSALRSTFINHEYSADNPQKQRTILVEGVVGSYWDGYEGRP